MEKESFSKMVFAKYPKKIPHGLMFHHFHGGRHYEGQGSLSQKNFEDILQFVGFDRILDPQEWVRRLDGGQLKEGDVCISLDDSLLCQFDIALPVLEKYNLKAFWFIYSSVFQGGLGKFEIYRVFRSKFFKNIDNFYSVFFEKVFQSEFGNKAREVTKEFDIKEYNKIYPFYSFNDTRFRFIRDRAMNPQEFETIMDVIIADYGTGLAELSNGLWMSNENLMHLSERGHIVGLHSYSHPTAFASLPRHEQWKEYSMNYDHIKKVCGKTPVAIAHPVNSYNDDTFRVLNRLGVSCGFRSNMFPRYAGGQLNRSRYEMAREDSSNITRMNRYLDFTGKFV